MSDMPKLEIFDYVDTILQDVKKGCELKSVEAREKYICTQLNYIYSILEKERLSSAVEIAYKKAYMLKKDLERGK
jgi:hypothetical protein